MEINVIYLAQVKKASGMSMNTIEVDAPCTVQEFITKKLCGQHEKLREFILDECGSIRKMILIFAGDSKIDFDVPQELKDGDEITIMTPIAGG